MTSTARVVQVPVPDDAETADPVRILIVDEQTIFRHGLRRLLETRPTLRIVGEAATSAQAAALARELSPHVLLLGLSDNGVFPLEALEQMVVDGLPLRTILLTGALDAPEVIAAAIQLGASAVVPKDSEPEALFRTIDEVTKKQSWSANERPSSVAASLKRLDHTRRRLKCFGLTRRELDILRSVVRGSTNKAIARRLSISENTVKRHLTHIFDKVGASNRLELALFASHHGLVDQF
jgi:DNA-binding NarL/FixJ family response regulator